jgi:hypothetical protein
MLLFPSTRRADELTVWGRMTSDSMAAVPTAGVNGGMPVGESLLRSRLRAVQADSTRAEPADELLTLLDGGALRRAAGLTQMVDRAPEWAVRPR